MKQDEEYQKKYEENRKILEAKEEAQWKEINAQKKLEMEAKKKIQREENLNARIQKQKKHYQLCTVLMNSILEIADVTWTYFKMNLLDVFPATAKAREHPDRPSILERL